MSQRSDWLPAGQKAWLNMAKDRIPVLNDRKVSWNVTDAQIGELSDLAEDAANALAAVNTEDTRTPVAPAHCRTAFKALATFMRDMKRRHFFSPSLVDPDDWAALGMKPPDAIPTPHPAPVLKPVCDAEPSGKGRHRVTAVNPQTEDKKKPPLVKGVAFAHHIRDADAPKPAAAEMPSVFQARTARVFQWDEADYGRVADYAAAYENEGGKRGPWSDVVSVIIAWEVVELWSCEVGAAALRHRAGLGEVVELWSCEVRTAALRHRGSFEEVVEL